MKENFENNNEDADFSPVVKYEEMLIENEKQYFDVEEMEQIIEHYLEEEMLSNALNACQYGLTLHTSSATLLILLSEIYLESDQSIKALKVLQSAIEKNPCNSDAYTALGGMYSRLKQPKEAIHYYTKSMEYMPIEEHEEVLFDIAFEYQNLRQFKKALQFLLKIIDTSPQNEMAMFEIGLCYSELDQDKEAIIFFEKYLDEFPYSYIGWFNLANCYMKQGNYDKAIFAFDYSTIINEFFPAAFYGKANGYIQKEEYEKAILVLNETFALEQPHSFAYCTIGECYEKMNNLDRAQHYYEKSIEIDKQYADAWIGLGIIYKMKKEYDKSLKHLNIALNLNENDLDAINTKAEIFEITGQFEKAIACYADLVTKDTSDEDAWFNYGSLLARNKMINDAIDILEIGFEMTNSAAILYKMASISFEFEEYGSALLYLEEGLETFPKEIDKFYDYYPNYSQDEKINKLLSKYLKK